MAYTVNETITDYINSGHAADSWTVLSAITGNGGSFVPTITEITTGVYKVEFTATVSGTWFLSIDGAASGQYDGTYDVDPATPVTGLTPTPVIGGTTLGDLRRRLGYRLGDLIVATATADGTPNQFTDQVTLRRANDAYRSWEVCVVAASVPANVGLRRSVQGSNQATGTITVQPAMPGMFTTGDIVELHGSAGVGWSVAEKHAAINDAIAQAATMGGIEAVVDADAPFDRGDPLVTVPGQLRFVHAIEWLDADGRGHTIPYAKTRNKPGWWANKATGQIEIAGAARESADSYAVRFYGHGDHVTLINDTDVTLVNPTWIIAAAAYYLALGYGQGRDPEKMRSIIADTRQEMGIWRRAATRVRPANSVAVRGT